VAAENYTRHHKCKKSVKRKNKEQIQLHLFYCKISTLFQTYHYFLSFCQTQKLHWHLWRQNTAVLRVFKLYVAIYCTRFYLISTNEKDIVVSFISEFHSLWEALYLKNTRQTKGYLFSIFFVTLDAVYSKLSKSKFFFCESIWYDRTSVLLLFRLLPFPCWSMLQIVR